MRALHLGVQLVETVEISLGGSDNDIGIRALTVDDTPAARQSHGHLALGVGAAGNVVNRIELQLGAALNDAFDRTACGVSPVCEQTWR